MAGDRFERTTFAELISEGALEIGDGYRAKNDELGGDGLMFLRAGHVSDTHIDFEGVERFHVALESRVQSKVAKPGDAVVTTKGNSTGRTTYVTPSMPPFVYSPHLSYWRSLDPGRVEGGFLRYWSKGPEFREQLAGMKASTDMAPYLSLIDQKRLGITLPPTTEQRAIAHILGTLDDKIELNRRMSETLEAMARALFKSWFVDFDPVRAKMEGRDPGLPKPLADLFSARLVDSEFGEIPQGWEVGKLGALVNTVKGCSYKSEELADSDTALVTLKSFSRGGGYRPDGLKSFSGTYKAEQVVKPGEVVIACTDVTQAAEVIGRPAIVRGTSGFQRLVASLDTLIVRPRDSSMTRAFLYFLGGTEAFVTHTYAYTTGTTVLHLAREAVPSFTFALPPRQLVENFDALAARVLDRIQALEEESRSLASLRDSLLPKLISGELRAMNAEAVLEERV